MLKLSEYINKKMVKMGGAVAGKMELVKTSVHEARAYAEDLFMKFGRELDVEIPHFDRNYLFAQRQAGSGTTKRKDMPVIENKDVKDLQMRLKNGYLDVNRPFGSNTNTKNPFPEGLSGDKAKEFLEGGLWKYDNSSEDDKVQVKTSILMVGDLKPIQKQIYFDKSIKGMANNGVTGTLKFLSYGTFIVSSDGYIIDGHHRYLSAILANPKLKVKCMVIGLPISKLLPLTLAYSDAVGNIRNK